MHLPVHILPRQSSSSNTAEIAWFQIVVAIIGVLIISFIVYSCIRFLRIEPHPQRPLYVPHAPPAGHGIPPYEPPPPVYQPPPPAYQRPATDDQLFTQSMSSWEVNHKSRYEEQLRGFGSQPSTVPHPPDRSRPETWDRFP